MTNPVSKISKVRSTKVLELIHSDIVGPINPISKGKFRYSMNFVDDYSGAVKTYLLRQKSDAHQALVQFIADVSPYGKIKRLRCGNGTEYICKNFRNVCSNNKIRMKFSSPRSPHQNGVAESNYRAIYEMARCLLAEAKLPKILWPLL